MTMDIPATTAITEIRHADSVIDPDTLCEVMREQASTVTVVTAASDGALEGATVTAFCSVSLEPPIVLVSLRRQSSTRGAIERSGYYGVNILSSADRELALYFASRAPDKFADVSHHFGATGIPLLKGVAASLECRVIESVAGGDHTIYLGEVVAARTTPEAAPLIYFRRSFRSLAGVSEDHHSVSA